MSAEMWVAVITNVSSLVGVIITVYFGNSKTQYRIEQLEKKQDKHNSLIERVYKLEEHEAVVDHRIKDLERK